MGRNPIPMRSVRSQAWNRNEHAHGSPEIPSPSQGSEDGFVLGFDICLVSQGLGVDLACPVFKLYDIPRPRGPPYGWSSRRLLLFDRRWLGMSDLVPTDQLPNLEARMDDIHAVMDAVASLTSTDLLQPGVRVGHTRGVPRR
jgi:hypothetical protein